MEPDPRKIKDIGSVKQFFLKKIKSGSVMSAHVECAKHSFNVLALLTKNYNVFFFSDTATLNSK